MNDVTHLNNDFFKFKIPEYVYIMGYLWADGSVHKNTLSLEIVEKDAKIILPIIKKTGNWHISKRKARKSTWQNTEIFYIYCKNNTDMLKKFDFHKKSGSSPEKLLKIIPKKLHYMFFRGFFDGDGCWSKKENAHNRSFVICSVYNQDWNFCKKLFDHLNIKYRVRNILDKKGSSSKITITDQTSLTCLGEFIYKDNLKILLPRKYKKYIKIKNWKTKKANYYNDSVYLFKKGYNPIQAAKISKHSKCSIYRHYKKWKSRI